MQASLCPVGGGIRTSTLHASTDQSLASLPLGRATRLGTNDLEAIQACCICPLCMVASRSYACACVLFNAVPPALASPLLLSVLLHGQACSGLARRCSTKEKCCCTFLQVPLDLALGTLRLSVGRHTTQEDVDSAVRLIAEAAQRYR